MNKENTGHLIENFSFFSSDPKFDFGDGWFPLFKGFCEKLKRFDIKDIQSVTAKERSGELCFDVTTGTKEDRESEIKKEEKYDTLLTLNRLLDLMSKISATSRTICEKCGEKGAKTRKIGGGAKTFCDIHHFKAVYDRMRELAYQWTGDNLSLLGFDGGMEKEPKERCWHFVADKIRDYASGHQRFDLDDLVKYLAEQGIKADRKVIEKFLNEQFVRGGLIDRKFGSDYYEVKS